MSDIKQPELVSYQKDGITYQRRQRREFTGAFKQQIVELHNAGKRRADLVREYDLSESALNR